MKKMMPIMVAGAATLGLVALVPTLTANAQTSALSGYYVNQAQKLVLHKSGKYLLVGDYQQVQNGRVKTYKIVSEKQTGKQVTVKYRTMHWRYAHNFQEAAVSHHYLGKKVKTTQFNVTKTQLKTRLSKGVKVRGLQPNSAKPGTTYTFKQQTGNPVAAWVTKFETQRLTAQNEALKAYAASQAALGYTVMQPAVSDAQLQSFIQQAIAHDVSLVAKPYLGQAMPQPIQL